MIFTLNDLSKQAKKGFDAGADEDFVAVGEHSLGHLGDTIGVIKKNIDGARHVLGGLGFTEHVTGFWNDFLHVGIADKARHAAGFGFDQRHGVIVEIVRGEDVEVGVLDFLLDGFKGGGAVEDGV